MKWEADYVSKGSYGRLFKASHRGKVTAIKVQVFEPNRRDSILREMLVYTHLQERLKHYSSSIGRKFNPFFCELLDCSVVSEPKTYCIDFGHRLKVNN